MGPGQKTTDRYLDDLAIGEVWCSKPIPISGDDIRAFDLACGALQGTFVNVAKANQEAEEEIVASGWHLIAIAMREFVRAQTLGTTPIIGMGADEIRWLKPVRPGTTLTFRREIIDLRRSSSKPDRGVVTTKLLAEDQIGDIVLEMKVLTRVPVRA
ncbi:MaoC/PaaZ C-terminal domain-containing protein [Cupriavidus sp. WKF15]|uniref:MaoC/PaaZ C-terminal domain-containing protein n=1 Tax=Cupriavidus sp. WKF15 TaxID=3032282 RepID=UPI0023E0FF8F|nr:MaoC/PaaZ C-terminal domain-containing protein [Cupriavidus sp. WKF15]WER50790.1 MaoC/PaaZ C-terminal domain-containing protein [Cupriavidus sp. WKF15]